MFTNVSFLPLLPITGETTSNGGSWLTVLKYEKGARLFTPEVDTVLTNAIGLGTTALIRNEYTDDSSDGRNDLKEALEFAKSSSFRPSFSDDFSKPKFELGLMKGLGWFSGGFQFGDGDDVKCGVKSVVLGFELVSEEESLAFKRET